VQISKEYLTAAEVAAILKVSTDTIIRKFENRNGVLDLGNSESRFKRRYRVLRIPREELERFIVDSRIL
jgi:Helix-turn-helix domain